ncbi:DUF4270 domain-containing protein [Sphingobacterium sp. SRCM116780]|uniref:DUF4270 family protein n=1 Tax=Sphingobacterium sp. SRCM116780 TaxID=2907623 RepID=UPI001F2AF674|nr:DUF4270 family protein [Sphingobacterium sp. SRCM116780]UIR55924.1 DUF4270 domain-containing protein [Sphingobacterium sp. SRCM116780]
MIKNFKRRSIQFLFSALLLTAFMACNKDISLSLDNSRDESMGIVPVDSIQVNVATYQLDDVPTSATGVVLVGKNSNAITGSVSATSYMRLGIGDITTASIPTAAVYDSITFVLKPNKYYYGDTTQNQTISVHRLTEQITLKEVNSGSDINERPVFVSGAAIYNNQKFAYDPTALGTLSFKPFVNKLDSISIKLNNNLGNTLFSYIKDGNINISSNDNFAEFFKGIALVPGNNNTAVIGYQDTVFMQIHYNLVNDEGFKVNRVAKFNLASKSYQFNNVEADRSGTSFNGLSLVNPELKSSSTQGDVFLEGSTGTVVKLNFPTLLALVNDPTVAINKAELVIETEGKYYSSFFKAPTSLILMVANAGGNPVSMVNSPYTTTVQQAGYAASNDVGANAKYTFNLIEYLNNIKKESYYNTSLFLSVPTTGLFSKTDRLIVAKDSNKKPKIKLNILYTKF